MERRIPFISLSRSSEVAWAELWEAMGGMSGASRPAVVQGDGVRYDMSLEFTKAIFGTEKEFEAAHLETCSACTGTAAKAGTSRKSCPACGGMGQVMRAQDTPFGTFSQVSTCTTCGGENEVISDYCRKCGGEGRIRVKKNIEVKLPAGVHNGSTLRVRGEGGCRFRRECTSIAVPAAF